MNRIIAFEQDQNGKEKVQIERTSYETNIGISLTDNSYIWFPINIPLAKLMLRALKRYIEE